MTWTFPELPEDNGEMALDVCDVGADVATLMAELAVEEAAVVGMMAMEIGVVLEGATDAGADDALTTGELEFLEAEPDDEPAVEPDEATPLTGPQVPVKVPESEVLRVTSASGPGFG